VGLSVPSAATQRDRHRVHRPLPGIISTRSRSTVTVALITGHTIFVYMNANQL